MKTPRSLAYILTIVGVFSVLIPALAVWSGGSHCAAMPMLWGTVIGSVIIIIGQWKRDRLVSFMKGCVKDPLFYAGAALCVLASIRLARAWWPELPLEHLNQHWMDIESPPQIIFAISAPEARLHLAMALGSFVIAIAIRHGIESRTYLRKLLLNLILVSLIMTVLGFIQYISGTDHLYWIYPRYRHFFGTFYYENHAGQYAYLMVATALGWILHQIFRERLIPDRKNAIFYLVSLALLFLAVVYSMSRSAIIFGGLLFAAGAIYLSRGQSKRIPSALRLKAITYLSAVCITGLVIISGAIGDDIREDFSTKKPGQSLIEQAYDARVWQWDASWRMFTDHPFFGIGPEGFRYYIPFYTKPEQLPQLKLLTAGQAHNDVLQFLAENGIAGALLLAVCITMLLMPLRKSNIFEREMTFFPLLGIALVCVHSLWDLPFRNGAVLLTWTIVMCATSKQLDILKQSPPVGRPELNP